MASVLVVGTALLLRSYLVLLPDDPGFEASGRLAFPVELPVRDHPDPTLRQAILESLMADLNELPRVTRVTATTDLPMTEENIAFRIPLPDSPDGGPALRVVHVRAITPDYLEALGMTITRGRGFESSDRAGAPDVAIVNETMAAEFWPDRNPLGMRIRVPTPVRAEVDAEVVGVVSDAWISPGRDEPRPELFVPQAQEDSPSLAFVVETDEPAARPPSSSWPQPTPSSPPMAMSCGSLW